MTKNVFDQILALAREKNRIVKRGKKTPSQICSIEGVMAIVNYIATIIY